MTVQVYVDVVGGAAGDMLLAALLDAGASHADVQAAVEAVVPGAKVGTLLVERARIRAVLLEPTSRAGADRRTGSQLLAAVTGARLAEPVERAAWKVLSALVDAEASIHGKDPEEVALHELGSDDTLIDVVGIAAALHSLGAESLLVSQIPLSAGGDVETDHGPLPLPAPAVLELLRGFPVRGEAGPELVTPTAAAVFAALGEPSPVIPSMTIRGVGYGAGSRDTEGRPNVVRVIVGEDSRGDETQPTSGQRELVVLEANLDDFIGELVPDAIAELLAAGALDAWATPIHMKKGRPALVLSALCEPSQVARLEEVFFLSTSTFGVRSYQVSRRELERRVVSVPVGDGHARVKLGLLHGRVVTAKPEHDDVADLARSSGRPVRGVYDEAAQAARSLRHSTTAP